MSWTGSFRKLPARNCIFRGCACPSDRRSALANASPFSLDATVLKFFDIHVGMLAATLDIERCL